MLNAKLTIKLGPRAKEFVKIVGKGERHKRGRVFFKATKDAIEVNIEANDPAALLASVGSAIKQLKIVSDVDSIVE